MRDDECVDFCGVGLEPTMMKGNDYTVRRGLLNSDDVIDVYDDGGCDDEEREAQHSIKTQLANINRMQI